MFYSKLLFHRSVKDTRCIDSNLESGRYISRVGRASRFLSLESRYTYGTKLVSRYLLDRLVHTRRAFMCQAVDDIRPNAAGQ